MTQQYNQRNINQQGDAVSFTATVSVPNVALQPSVQLAHVESALAASIVTLPRAADAGQNAEITVVKSAAANTVTVAAPVGDTLVSDPGIVNPLIVQWGSLTVKADPNNNRWIAISPGPEGPPGPAGPEGPAGPAGDSSWQQQIAWRLTDWQDADYNSVAGDVVQYNTGGGSFTVFLPAAPEYGHTVKVLEVAGSAVNPLTISGNGNNMRSVAGVSVLSTTYQVARGWIQWKWDGGEWLLFDIRGDGV